MPAAKSPKATGAKKTMLAEGGKVGERVYKLGLADPRTGPERVAGTVNRAVQVDRKSPVRRYDDSPAVMAKNRAAVKRR